MRKIFLLGAIAFATCIVTAQDIKATYTKYEYEIPMRDGIKLFTSVYVPKDDSQKYPFMMQRTPYNVGPYGEDRYRATLGPSEHFAKEGFIFVYQDVRGRYMSEGVWEEVRPIKDVKRGPADTDESTDTYDTIDWLVKHVPNNNGKVGMWGISYPGFYVSAGMIDAHPALKAASPQAPVSDYYMGDDSFHNGAFMLAANFGFYTNFAERKGGPAPPRPGTPFEWGTPDGYEFYLKMGPLSNGDDLYFKHANPYWSEQVEHPNYDEYWQARSIIRHLKDITPAVMTTGGWFDAEDLAGPLKVSAMVERTKKGPANMLVMGPWSHGGFSRGDGDHLGNLDFASKTGAFYREKIEFAFFLYYLKGKGEDKFPRAWLFRTGANEWRKHDVWPPANAARKTLYFAGGGALTEGSPSDAGKQYDEYISDPAKPVPYIAHIAQGMNGDYMTEDQRFAGRRTDVLVYQTEPLPADVTIAGPITASLQVATSGTDSDFVVKLIDVYPGDYPDPAPPAGQTPGPRPANTVRMGGYQQLVRGEPFRGRFRNSFEKPEAFVPNQPARVEYAMPDVYHTFRKGHRIMVQVQSSWFPLTDRNPQKFVEILHARATDFQKATERVYHGSSVSVMVEP
jgi:putative CocE/NonD family hydrolase